MPALVLLDPNGSPTGVLVEKFPGQRLAMTGSAVTASGYAQNQAVRVTNATESEIFVRTDGTAAVMTGAAMIILTNGTDVVVVQNVGGTISMIGTSTVGHVYLTPIHTS
jgi:hypothetical protein